ncbi:MAG: hypothetical protein WDM86_11365 [Rhizomicrobium sp.]
MTHLNRYAGVFAALLLALLFAAPANAQATRTWVSGVGDDANPCSRTAPCKTFAGAISKTAVNGEINCLDPGGFGSVTITKSIALVCDFTEGGITNPSTPGITVNAAGAIVYLTGLDIEGIAAGTNGINFIQGAVLHVEHCKIRGNNAAGSTVGYGIRFAPATAASLYVADTIIADNGSGSGGTATGAAIGIVLPAGGSANVVLDRVRMEANTNGFYADTTATTGAGINATITDSVSSGGYVGVLATGTTPVNVMVDHTAITNSGGYGLLALGGTIRVGNSTITGNATSVLGAGGTVSSYGDNKIDANTTNTLPGTIPLH